ncbi:CDP-alcohol phosphatidyltransferase family protein [Desulfuribacillus stibiiarsenatis]|nr:CDP-alcohol phosphatidyltransferase family protein [Desulfuribacillus stibiiarsenatis]
MIPNFISLSRIILSLSLFLITPFSQAFYLIYIYCGISDMLDGFLARKMGTESRFGEILDSIADMVMVAVLLVILFPIIKPSELIIFWIIVIAIIRFSAMTVALMKYNVFISLHTYGNKITGAILFVFPLVIPYVPMNFLAYGIVIVASISAVEELFIQIMSRKLQVNRKHFFDRSL